MNLGVSFLDLMALPHDLPRQIQGPSFSCLHNSFADFEKLSSCPESPSLSPLFAALARAPTSDFHRPGTNIRGSDTSSRIKPHMVPCRCWCENCCCK